jgi:hypothetical protein
MPMLVSAVRNAVSASTGESSKQELVASGKSVANAARMLIQNAKFLASDRANQVLFIEFASLELFLLYVCSILTTIHLGVTKEIGRCTSNFE